jgi:hypothetical protein
MHRREDPLLRGQQSAQRNPRDAAYPSTADTDVALSVREGAVVPTPPHSASIH